MTEIDNFGNLQRIQKSCQIFEYLENSYDSKLLIYFLQCLADTEERVEAGHVRSVVVRVRETRLTNLFSNILIGISMLFLKVKVAINLYVRSLLVRLKANSRKILLQSFSLFNHLISLYFQYVLDYIPTPVLDGLFLYLAVTALYGNQMFERITLLFTEQVTNLNYKIPQEYVW